MSYYYSSTAKSINVSLLCIALMPLIALRGLYGLWKKERDERQGRLAAVFIVSMMPLPFLPLWAYYISPVGMALFVVFNMLLLFINLCIFAVNRLDDLAVLIRRALSVEIVASKEHMPQVDQLESAVTHAGSTGKVVVEHEELDNAQTAHHNL